mgnify:CR=1 FL=1|jgi:hypothetical protein
MVPQMNEEIKMENIMNQFKKVAPLIVDGVKARVTAEMTDAEIMLIIHEEIVTFFQKQQQMTNEYLAFDEDKRATFAAVMYEILAPMAASFKGGINPKYAEYVEKTGKTGALNFIINA